MNAKFIEPKTTVLTLTFEQSMLASSFDAGNPVDDALEGDISDWGNWNF